MSPAPHTRRYSAFISYRHADNTQEGRRWAEWLHRGLERYVVPPDLIGTSNLRGEPIRDSLYPIFRDEDELPANADLATGIRAALEVSDHLIVLCSPRSAVSPWVRKEVREFKELGRSDRILAIIIAGEPNADDPAKAREGILRDEECFCEELRFGAVREDGTLDWTVRTEPLAADLRPIGTRAEGFVTAEAYREYLTLNSSLTPDKIAIRTETYRQQLGHSILKVAAGLLGVPLGQLIDRDAAHRADVARQELAKAEAEAARLSRLTRRLSAAMIIAFVLALAAVYLSLVAAVARDSAMAQQHRAEDALARGERVIDYLVCDLHDNLRAVGRTELLHKVEDSVRIYYESEGTDAAALNAAKAFDQLGDLAVTRGDVSSAGKSYEKAAHLLNRVEVEPDAFALRYEKTVNLKNLAWVAARKKYWLKAESHWGAAFVELSQLGSVAKDHRAKWRAERLAAVLQDLKGDLLRAQGRVQEAAHAYELAVNIGASLVALLDREITEGDTEAIRVLRERSVALGKQGDLHLNAEPPRTAMAMVAFKASLSDRERLVALSRARNFEYLADLSVALNKMSQVEILTQEWSDAHMHIDRAISLAKKLTEFEPANSVWWNNAIMHLELRGELFLAEGRATSAVPDFQEALQMAATAQPSKQPAHQAMQERLQAKLRQAVESR